MSIAENTSRIEEQIEKACLRSGRKREEISLMAVTKLQSPQAVNEAWESGIRLFGENRVQEAAAKYDNFKERYPGAELHLIGTLQRNKAKAAVALFDCVQSLDREDIVTELAKQAAACNRQLPVLLEFRTGEDSKSGFIGLDALYGAVEMIFGCPSIVIKGLMTIAPNTRDEKTLRSAFRQLAAIRRDLEQRYPKEDAWRCLSMGMSGDFEIAVEEGSTLLRIGTAIFGERT
jgi:pyridoxal phosphate enzyme (YggS family)